MSFRRRFLSEPVLMLALALAGLGFWGFIELADEVREGATRSFDEAILLALRTPGDLADPLGPPWIEEMGRDLTALGGIAVLTMLTLAAAGFTALQGHWRATLFLLASVGTGLLASTLAKAGFDRARPELVPYDSAVYSSSFPSGHSMMAAVAYLTLALLVGRVLPSRVLRGYLLLLAAITVLLVGVSRVYVGVHWPTDVLAGWAGGAAWAALCAGIARALGRRGDIEPDCLGDDRPSP